MLQNSIMRRVWLIVLALLPLTSIAERSPETNGRPAKAQPQFQGGIRGVVVKGPTTPLNRIGETNSVPLANAVVSVRPQKGGAVFTRKTDDKGRFEFQLPPGKYIIALALDPNLRLRTRGQAAEVQDKRFTEVVVTCDTGIR